MRIALDVFGGGNAPESTINGAKLACEAARNKGIADFQVTLVGDASELPDYNIGELDEYIDFYDIPGEDYYSKADPPAVGRSRNSPISVALRLHHEGVFDAVVSAGSTGAQVVASLRELGTCKRVNRPAIGALFPTVKGFSLLLDIGASLVAGPRHLVQFAAMGYHYSREMLDLEDPRISLLNIGKESGAGLPAIRRANKILEQSKFDYMGFIEGGDVMAGEADVIVTNGFVGNILLKYLEGLPGFISHIFSADSAKKISEQINEKLDYQIYGGEPLLGIKGVSLISHGSSTALAISSAIMKAYRMAEADFHSKIESFMLNGLDKLLPASLMDK